ncbi:NADH:flavin oxidoreductase [Mangrovicoccus algicola]|uniref:NADH:flavin oxidoreductase n=1 Tax=Mangrovicoccus algicola TaxID=2771008 RepID=A0A8J7CJ42_9RHOB|nr:NADH:flavin oxidoreductase [Mangrovicoccus algicola]MBE3640365.1 NADH:flavin oxidoreductase [Mangrovicoccus algicola]
MSTDPLLQPYRLKHLELRNRIIITSHEPAYAEDGMPKARYLAYHLERARAGVALTMTAGSASVARDSPPAFNNILAWKDEVVGWMRQLARACHDEGCAVMIQLTHLGRRTRWDRGDWLPVLSASHRREAAHRASPKRMEDWDIARVIGDYADAAERMQAAGLDGVEIEAYGHLADQFWSPLTNEMDAPWGGSLENRLRFSFAILQAVRDRCGPDFILGLRYSGDDRLPGGVGAAEGLEISRRLAASGLVDFLNVVRGHIDTDPGLTDVIPVQGMAAAPHLDFAGRIRAGTGMPVFHAARIPDLATARHAVASGLLDMVGMTRAHIADPHLVAKLVAGQEARIRPCVGANYCLDRIYQGGMALCLHNPSSGREIELPHAIAPAAAARRVTVVGAGPAGMEAARVAALRGHAVTVLEAADRPGGQVRLSALSERRREMAAIIDWRAAECDRLGVAFRYNTYAEEEDVLATDPEEVVIATGGMPGPAPLEAGEDLTVSSWDILSGDAAPGRNVLVFDEAGDAAGLQAAEKIAATGAAVEIVTPDRAFAPEVMGMTLVPFLRALQAADSRFTVTWRLRSVMREGNGLRAVLGSDYGAAEQVRQVDQVVVNHGTLPLEDLYFALKPLSSNLGEIDHEALVAGRPQALCRNPAGRFRLWRIGDAVAARNTHAAIHDALRLVRQI